MGLEHELKVVGSLGPLFHPIRKGPDYDGREPADVVAKIAEILKEGGATPGPRMQRLAKASGEPEQEVALFLMQFEAMRESTRRIAEGEDPDAVNESLSAPPGSNRAVRRNAAKKKQKA